MRFLTSILGILVLIAAAVFGTILGISLYVERIEGEDDEE